MEEPIKKVQRVHTESHITADEGEKTPKAILPRVAIIGGGNVAWHLCKALRGNAYLTIVNPRTLAELDSDSDFILICVSDYAITEVASRIPFTKAIVAHTSGSISMENLKGKFKHKGVFYPLQTFSKEFPLDYSEIPFFIEGDSSFTRNRLRYLATLISPNVTYANSEQRRRMHLSSVFACNFTNHMYAIAYDILRESGIEWQNMQPLVKATIMKAFSTDPATVQTGPAARKDNEVMERHCGMLKDSPLLEELYRALSHSIITWKDRFTGNNGDN